MAGREEGISLLSWRAQEDSFLWVLFKGRENFPILVDLSRWDMEMERPSSGPDEQWGAVMTSVLTPCWALHLRFPKKLSGCIVGKPHSYIWGNYNFFFFFKNNLWFPLTFCALSQLNNPCSGHRKRRWVSVWAVSKAGAWLSSTAYAESFPDGEGLGGLLTGSFLICCSPSLAVWVLGLFFFNSSSHLASPNYFLLLITSTGNRPDCWIKNPIKG